MLRLSRTGIAMLAAAVLLSACSGANQARESSTESDASEAATPEVRYIQPGAPGEPSKVLTAEEVAKLDLSPPEHTPEDVEFMQMMIIHHEQATELVELIEGRSTREDLALFAERILISQADEIDLMKRWLEDRDEAVPEGPEDLKNLHSHHGHNPDDPDVALMPGMLSENEMKTIREASGPEFDKLWIEGMTKHHQGAIQMVEDLFAADGGQEPEIFRFANHVISDQNIEISRMNIMLADVLAGGDGKLPDDETGDDKADESGDDG